MPPTSSIVSDCHWLSGFLKDYLRKVEFHCKFALDGTTIYWLDKADRLCSDYPLGSTNRPDMESELHNIFNNICSRDLEAMAECTLRNTPWGYHIHDVITMRILLEK